MILNEYLKKLKERGIDPEKDIPKLLKMVEVMAEALDKYTSNPDSWDKSIDEWFAVHAKKAIAQVEVLAKEANE